MLPRLCWTFRWLRWHQGSCPFDSAVADETVLLEIVHLVEWPDVRHPVLDLALWRVRRRGRVRQPLLPHARRQDRSRTWVRAALGDLQRLRGSVDDPAVLARVDAPYGRSAADRGWLQAARVGEAAPAEPHR